MISSLNGLALEEVDGMKIRSQLLLVLVTSLFVATSLVAGVQLYTAYRQDKENMQNILQN
jgi:hypothetical protein